MSTLTRTELQDQIRAAHRRVADGLGRGDSDENAIPAYLQGTRLSRHFFWGKLDQVVKGARLRPGDRVFDFGCGTGILLPRLAGDGRRVQATDLRPQIAQQLVQQLQLPGVEFVPADGWSDAVLDGSLDVLIAANVLEHIEARRALLTTMAAKLRPGGRLVISGPTENRLYRLGRWMIGFADHFHVADVFDVFADVEAVGLRRVWRRRYPFAGPACLYVIAAYEKS